MAVRGVNPTAPGVTCRTPGLRASANQRCAQVRRANQKRAYIGTGRDCVAADVNIPTLATRRRRPAGVHRPPATCRGASGHVWRSAGIADRRPPPPGAAEVEDRPTRPWSGADGCANPPVVHLLAVCPGSATGAGTRLSDSAGDKMSTAESQRHPRRQ